MLNLKPLYHFVLVVEEKNFGAAARRANLSQPALSNSIRGLEERIGVKLFQRDERPIKVTHEGQEILERAQWLLFEARNLDDQISALRTGAAGCLKLGMAPVFAASYGGSVIGDFSRQSPRTTFETDVRQTGHLLDELENESIEIAICDLREVHSRAQFDIVELPPRGGGCFCRPHHPILSGASLNGRLIHEYGLVSVWLPQEVQAQLRDVFLGEDSIDPLMQLQCDNVTLLQDTVRQSDLILLTTRQSVQMALDERQLIELPFEVSSESHWGIVTLRKKVLRPAARAFIETVKKICT